MSRIFRWFAHHKRAMLFTLAGGILLVAIWSVLVGGWPLGEVHAPPRPSTEAVAPRAPGGAQLARASVVDLLAPLTALLAGALGGMAGWWFVFSSYRKDVERRLHDISRQLHILQNSRERTSQEIDRLYEEGKRLAVMVGQRLDTPMVVDESPVLQPLSMAPESRAETSDCPPPKSVAEPPTIDVEAIGRDYSETAAGHISRGEFEAFFHSLGVAGPVEVGEGGRTIYASPHEDALLTSVNVRGRILVFPSYSFAANFNMQYPTMASVPEGVARLFELVPADGELTLTRPAIFVERDTGLELCEIGEIRGFSG